MEATSPFLSITSGLPKLTISRSPVLPRHIPLHVRRHSRLQTHRRDHSPGTTPFAPFPPNPPNKSNTHPKQKNLSEPYNWDEYASSFFPQAELLSQAARRAEEAGKTDDACRLYLRSSAVYRIARFPAPRSEQQRLAWDKGKEVFYRGAG